MQEQLIMDNHNLVYHILQKMNLYNQLDEYYDIAVIGLIKAAKNYDETKQINFSTFAGKCIRNEILLYLRQQQSNRLKANYNTISLEKTVFEENGNKILLIDKIPGNVNIEQELINNEKIIHLYKAISNLSDSERFIIEHSYGLNNKKILRQKQLAEIIGQSQANVSRIIKKIFKKIKQEMEKYDHVCNTKSKK